MFRRRRPLLRAAAVGGGAYLAGKRRAENEQYQAGQPAVESQQAPAPAATGTGISSDAVLRLQELGKLHDQGVLTDDEFATQKERLLAS